jgi:hypothetical protein
VRCTRSTKPFHWGRPAPMKERNAPNSAVVAPKARAARLEGAGER